MAEAEKVSSTPHTGATLDEESSLDTCTRLRLESPPSSDNSRPDSCAYPDGGLKANLTVLGAFIALFCTFGQMNAFGTFQAWYAEHQLAHRSASTISWIGSLQLWIFFFSGCPIGQLFDDYGPKWLMSIGTLCYFLSIMLISVCTDYYHYILTHGILFGLGVGLLFYPSLASISTQFYKYRATALGIAAAGSSLGGVVYPIMLHRLFYQTGFAWGVRISGFISGAGCVVATMLTSNVPQTKKVGNWSGVKALSDIRFVLLTAGGCFVALGLFIPFFYIVEYAQSISPSNHLSFYVLAVLNAGGALGRVVPAYISDRIGRFNLLFPAAFLSGLSCVVLWLGAETIPRTMAFGAVYGFFSGAFISLVTPCIAQISDIREVGARIGMLYTVISFPSLVGGPAAGAFLARNNGSYFSVIVFSGCTIMAGSFFILASKIAINRHILARV